MEVEGAAVFPSLCVGGRLPVAVCVYGESLRTSYPSASTVQEVQRRYHTLTVHHHTTPSNLATSQVHILDSGAGHRDPIQALAFSSAPPPAPLYLCSASQTSTTLWQLENKDGGLYCPSELWSGCGGEGATDIAFSRDALHVAVCRGTAVAVYSTESLRVETSLVGHTATVTKVLFTSLQPLTAITFSEDRTFKVWNLQDCSVSFQSHVISSSPFLSAAISLGHQQLAAATADGMIRVFDVREGGGFGCLMTCDLSKELTRYQQQQQEEEEEESGAGPKVGGVAEAGWVVVGMTYVECVGEEREEEDVTSPCCDLRLLLIIMQTRLLRLNANTLQLLAWTDLSEPLCYNTSTYSIPLLGTCDLAVLDSQVFLASGAVFSNQVTLLNLHFLSDSANGDEVGMANILSVLSEQALVENSPLRSVFSLKTKADTGAPKTRTSGRPAKSGRPIGPVSDQPLTFKSKVKSSGYTSAPRTTMFTPKARPGKAAVFAGKSATSPRKERGGGGLKQCYPGECGPTSHPHYSITRLSHQPLPLYAAAFNGTGSALVCGSADKSIYTVKMPPSTGKVSTYAGHDGAVLSCGWSHSQHWLLSSSTDGRACVWGVGGASGKDMPLLVLDRLKHNLRSQDSSEVKEDNQLFKKEISHAQFYYMDRFILLASANSLHLYKYHVDSQPPDDIKRYQSHSGYKLVTSVHLKSSQSITAVSAINDFHSYLVFVCGSNRSLEVHDMNVERCVRTMPNLHSRAVHCISQSKGSRFVMPTSTGHYDLFTTSATTDGIKLWDLRTNRCVCRYSSHANQSQPAVKASLSPCARYLATGSENRSAYIYDLRHPSPLHRLTGHSDTVAAVAYHPLKPMLVTTTLDGQLQFFTEK